MATMEYLGSICAWKVGSWRGKVEVGRKEGRMPRRRWRKRYGCLAGCTWNQEWGRTEATQEDDSKAWLRFLKRKSLGACWWKHYRIQSSLSVKSCGGSQYIKEIFIWHQLLHSRVIWVTPWSPSISKIDKNELDDKARCVEGQMNVRGDREEVRMCFRSPALLPNNQRLCGGTI